jgi:ubiquinone/menaquinone biosynthesis C-methylase UbiE
MSIKETDNKWEQIHSNRSWGKYPNEEFVRFIGRNYFKRSFTDRKKLKILEIGCGQGANLWFLAKEGFDVYGIDISPSAIEKAKEILEKEWNIKSVKLDVQDMKNLKFNDETFDVVFDIFSIAYANYLEIENIYKKIFKILKNNGKFWSFNPSECDFCHENAALVDYETLSDTDLLNILKEIGFKFVNIEKQVRTYDNQKKEVIHWIIEAI